MGREVSSCSPHEQVPSRCSSPAATPQIPKEAEAAEPAAKARVGACERPRGIPPCPCPAPGPRRAGRTRPIPQAARKQEATSSWERGQPHLWGAKLVSARLRAELGSPPRAGKGPEREQRPPGSGRPFPSPRGRRRPLPRPRATLTEGETRGRNPSPGPRGPGVSWGRAGRGPGGGREPRAALTGRQPGQQQRPPAGTVRGHGALSSSSSSARGRCAHCPSPSVAPVPGPGAAAGGSPLPLYLHRPPERQTKYQPAASRTASYIHIYIYVYNEIYIFQNMYLLYQYKSFRYIYVSVLSTQVYGKLPSCAAGGKRSSSEGRTGAHAKDCGREERREFTESQNRIGWKRPR